MYCVIALATLQYDLYTSFQIIIIFKYLVFYSENVTLNNFV